MIKNAQDNAKSIDLIPSVEFYTTVDDSELIEPSSDENEQETYVSDLQAVLEDITRQARFDVIFDKNSSNDKVNAVTIKRVEKVEEDAEVEEE